KCSYTRMLGAVCGDIAGSVYEHHNIKYIPDKDKLISHRAHFTDDSVLTLGVAVGIMNGLKKLNKYSDFTEDDEPVLSEEIKNSVYLYGNKYPYAGYGRTFRSWLSSADRAPYNSWANGSAMRVSYAGHAAHSLKDAEFLASVSAKVTHNHPEGIKGAVAIAAGIYILRDTPDKAEGKKRVYDYISKLYDIDFKLDDIRDSYTFDVSCAGSVPYAVKAFLEGESFEEVIALAISIGGDSDTIAAMAGSLAEVIYPIPEGYRDRVLKRLDYDFKSNLAGVIDFMVDTQSK
ncbi:MAG: ADP-ribosylglycohydrolase family protein, partial [Clostridia bacterium]|nr:ADP-ribosylglycohydrolase family protein [Clostridia bacterium]